MSQSILRRIRNLNITDDEDEIEAYKKRYGTLRNFYNTWHWWIDWGIEPLFASIVIISLNATRACCNRDDWSAWLVKSSFIQDCTGLVQLTFLFQILCCCIYAFSEIKQFCKLHKHPHVFFLASAVIVTPRHPYHACWLCVYNILVMMYEQVVAVLM